MRTTTIAAVLLLSAGPVAAGATPDLAAAQFRSGALPKRCRIEFRATKPDGLTVLFHVHDRENFAGLRLDRGGAVLFEVRRGKPRTLSSRLPAATSGTIFLRPGHALAVLGDRSFAAALQAEPGGRYGAAPGAGGRLDRLVLRPEEPLYFTDGFMRAEGTGEHWRPLAGRWSIRYERDTSRSANPFRCIARADGVGLMATGERHWHETTASVHVAGRTGTAGLAFAVDDASNYHVFRVGIGGRTSQLVRVRDGRETVLQTSRRVLFKDRWYKLSVRSGGGGTTCSVDGATLFRAADLIAVGRIGLYVQDARETLFDDVLVASSDLAASGPPKVELFSEVFEADQQMENWASLWGAWRPQRIGGRGKATKTLYWHKGDFFGDVSIGCTPAAAKGNWTAVLLVGGDGRDPDRGAALTVRGAGGNAAWSLAAGGKTLRSATAPWAGGVPISLARKGKQLIARAGGKTVLEAGPVELSGRRVGLWTKGTRVDLHQVDIRSGSVYDYLFEEAPVEWFARTGTWQITNRWVCDPRWSWLGGQSEQVAQMWTKRAFYGDQTVEFFAAFKMRQGVRYPHVGDINLTICGDGENLDSGYQVIYAGWGNRWTRLLRRGKVVAGSADAIIEGNFHRRWFHVKVRKVGKLLQLFVDDELVRQVRDPRPVDGGQIALWTVDNGIMIARVRIYAERSELRGCLKTAAPKAAPPAAGAAAPPEGTFVCDDFKSGPGGWAGRDGEQGAALELVPGGLMLTNTNGGGSFGVTACDRKFDLLRYPVIRLAWKTVSPDPVRWNLFARINGLLFELPLTAPPTPDAAVTLSGGPTVAFHGPADGKAHTAEIDLGAIVSRRYEKRLKRKPTALKVTDLYLANASNEKYLLCGFGGNRAGARVLLTGFAIQMRDAAR